MSALNDILWSSPDELMVKTRAEFNEVCQRAKDGEFRIFALETGKKGYLYRFELLWPTRKEPVQPDEPALF